MYKRLFDIVFSVAALVAFSPIILGLSLLVLISMGAPVFYRQKRPGLGGKPFEILKFRTMKELRDNRGNYLPDSERMTIIGKFLRGTSLDELPELINIIKGDMSIVGPRPLLMQYLKRYSTEQARRHEVRPGLTGWVQVNGRNTLTWEEKFKLDVWYVDNGTFLLDMKIILMTVKKVLAREGISHEGDATMPEFNPTILNTDTDRS